jgi:hypothetical protein
LAHRFSSENLFDRPIANGTLELQYTGRRQGANRSGGESKVCRIRRLNLGRLCLVWLSHLFQNIVWFLWRFHPKNRHDSGFSPSPGKP